MRFEKGKYYRHYGGRYISIVGEVETTRWGHVFVVEEADKTGHSISCAEINSEAEAENWVEISEIKWLSNFTEGKDGVF